MGPVVLTDLSTQALHDWLRKAMPLKIKKCEFCKEMCGFTIRVSKLSISANMADNQRALWAQTRASISEYERQACELQLDLQQELRDLQAAKERLAGIKKGPYIMRHLSI